MFHVIERDLNDVIKNFIHSQLRNNNKKPTQRKWTVDDKAFFLSWYKRSPKRYTYLSSFFILPSIHLLKGVLSKIPSDTGINESVIENLKRNVRNMTRLDRYCSLLFDEVSLHSELYYDEKKQKLIGYEDIGHLGRSIRRANHALVFMDMRCFTSVETSFSLLLHSRYNFYSKLKKNNSSINLSTAEHWIKRDFYNL